MAALIIVITANTRSPKITRYLSTTKVVKRAPRVSFLELMVS